MTSETSKPTISPRRSALYCIYTDRVRETVMELQETPRWRLLKRKRLCERYLAYRYQRWEFAERLRSGL